MDPCLIKLGSTLPVKKLCADGAESSRAQFRAQNLQDIKARRQDHSPSNGQRDIVTLLSSQILVATVKEKKKTHWFEMLNATVELMALWASSRPSLLAFCFSHIIIAVILLGSRSCASNIDGHGECVAEAGEAETPQDGQFQSVETNNGGTEDSTGATNVGGRGSASSNATCHAAADACEAGVRAAQLQTSDTNVGGDEASVSAGNTLQGRFSHEDEEGDDDELMVRAEDFIQRMNRAWRTENVRAC